jgi:hypothetical protein
MKKAPRNSAQEKNEKTRAVYALVLHPLGDELEIFEEVGAEELARLLGTSATGVVALHLRRFGSPIFYAFIQKTLQGRKITFRDGCRIAFTRERTTGTKTDWLRWFAGREEDVYGDVVIYHPKGEALFHSPGK